MTIKFERFADNYMCKDYFYKIWDDSKNADYEDVLDFRSLKMKDYEFEKLFKDMAKELDYAVIKRPTVVNPPFKVKGCLPLTESIEQANAKPKSEQEHKLELRIDRLDKKITNIFQDLNSVINNNITNIDKNEKKWYKVLGRIDNINENVERIDNKCNNDYISNDSQIQKLQEQLSGQDEWNDYISERLEKLENISNHLKDMNDYRQKQIEINKRHVEMLVNQDKRIDELEKQVSVLSEDLDWDE